VADGRCPRRDGGRLCGQRAGDGVNIRCSTDDEVWQAVTAAQEKQRREGGFGLVLDDSKPAAIITSERYEELWQAVTARCDELKQQHAPDRGNRRSAGLVDSDGRGISAVLGIGQDDGTDLVYHVRARTVPPRGDVSVSYDGPWLDSHDHFWAEQLADRTNAVVIGGEHYRVNPDLSPSRRDGAGFGGALHCIRNLATGMVTETRNLWYQGIVPPKWREQMPDDAEFVTADSLAAAEAQS
jgi:hypothetical protein